jgi:hypothetical protein
MPVALQQGDRGTGRSLGRVAKTATRDLEHLSVDRSSCNAPLSFAGVGSGGEQLSDQSGVASGQLIDGPR